MNIKACLFDLDGVIVDTARYHYQAWRKLANSLGFDFTESQNEQLKGVSRLQSLNLILEIGGLSLSEEEKNRLADQKNSWYLELIDLMTPEEILPGVSDFLDDLINNGLLIGLGSASKNAKRILDHVGLSTKFSVIVDGNATTKGKPDPEVFLLGAEALGVNPSDCVVFEDAPKGVDAALVGGFFVVGVGSEHSLGHAHLVIQNFQDLNHRFLEQFG